MDWTEIYKEDKDLWVACLSYSGVSNDHLNVLPGDHIIPLKQNKVKQGRLQIAAILISRQSRKQIFIAPGRALHTNKKTNNSLIFMLFSCL